MAPSKECTEAGQKEGCLGRAMEAPSQGKGTCTCLTLGRVMQPTGTRVSSVTASVTAVICVPQPAKNCTLLAPFTWQASLLYHHVCHCGPCSTGEATPQWALLDFLLSELLHQFPWSCICWLSSTVFVPGIWERITENVSSVFPTSLLKSPCALFWYFSRI